MTHSGAEDRFVDWLEDEGGDPAGFDAFVAKHPEMDAELRRLHSDWRVFEPLLAGAVPGSIHPGIEAGHAAADDGPEHAPFPHQLPEGTRYRFRGVIGRGGGGVVLKVWDTKLDRPLAMKIVLGRGETVPTAETPFVAAGVVSRFIDEARIASQLDHPGIVPVHELGRDSTGRAYFTMRLVQGEDLSQIFRRVWAGEPEWTEARVLGVLVRVSEAVAFAHERGVLHRDLKPANVMVGRHGEVHVMDWGLARARQDASDLNEVHSLRDRERGHAPESPLLTGAGDTLGTPAYMAPEQARGDVDALDERTDVYALGAMLYELLARRPPYVQDPEHDSPFDILHRIGGGPPEPLAAAAPGAAAPLAAIAGRAMAREPSRRYAQVGEVGADLQSFLDGRVVGAYESGSWAELRRWVGRNRGVAVGSLLAVVLVVGALIQALRQQARLESSLYAASIASAAHHSIQSDYPAMRRALDGPDASYRGLEWRLLDALQDSSVVRYTGSREYPLAAAFTPDGERVVSVHADDRVHVFETWTGAELASFAVSDAWESPPVIAPGGTRCALLGGDGDVGVWGLDGVRIAQRRAPAADGPEIEALHFIGERTLLISAGDRVTRWEFEADTERQAARWSDGRFEAFAERAPRAVRRFASGYRVVNLEDGTTASGLQLEAEGYSRFALDANGSTALAYRDESEETTVWSAATGSVLLRTEGYPEDHAMRPDGSAILVHDSGIWRVVDTADGRALLERPTGSYAPDGWILPKGVGMVHASAPRWALWVEQPRGRSHPLRGHDGFATAVAFHPDGMHMIAGAPEGTLRLFRVDQDAAVVERDARLHWASLAATRSPLPRIAWYEGGSLEVLSGETLSPLGSVALPGIPERATRLAAALEAPLVFVHDGEKVFAAIDVVRLAVVATGPLEDLTVAFDRDTGLACARGARASWALAAAFDPSADASRPLATSRRGVRADPAVDAMEMLTPIRLLGSSSPIQLDGHRGGIASVAFSESGDRLLSSGDDGLRLWRVHDGALLMHLPPESLGNAREVFDWRIEPAEPVDALFAVSALGRAQIIPLRPAYERFRRQRTVEEAGGEARRQIDHAVELAGSLEAALPRIEAAAPKDGPLRAAIYDEITRRCGVGPR